jgi:ribosomal protein L16/L10AE
MPLQPARVKYRKMQRGSRAGIASRGNTVAFFKPWYYLL